MLGSGWALLWATAQSVWNRLILAANRIVAMDSSYHILGGKQRSPIVLCKDFPGIPRFDNGFHPAVDRQRTFVDYQNHIELHKSCRDHMFWIPVHTNIFRFREIHGNCESCTLKERRVVSKELAIKTNFRYHVKTYIFFQWFHPAINNLLASKVSTERLA